MSYTLYAQLTAKARALEMIVAVFAAFWAFQVLIYALTGTEPLAWAGMKGQDGAILPGALLALGGIHAAGTWGWRRGAHAAVARAIAMAGMTVCFAYLAFMGSGTSAAPTYFGIAIACFGAVFPAAKDAHYARGLHVAVKS